MAEEEPIDMEGSPVQESFPVGPHSSRLPYPPMDRGLPLNPSNPRNLGPEMMQGLHQNFKMSSYARGDTGFYMPQDPARNMGIQRPQYPLEAIGIPIQSSFQRHPVSTRNLDHQVSQSFLSLRESPKQSTLERHPGCTSKQNLHMSQWALGAEATSKPPSLQWNSELERYQGPQESFRPSWKPLPRMNPDPQVHSGLPTSGTNSVDPVPQMTSPFSECPDSVISVESVNPSDTYKAPFCTSKKRREKRRASYSPEQILKLETFFNDQMYPSKEQRLDLAEDLGVADYQIQIWFKNHRAKYKKKNLQNISEPPENMESSKDVGGSTSSQGGSSVLDSAAEESMSSGTSYVDSILQLYPSLEESLHNEETSEGARCGLQEDHCAGQAPAAAAGPGHFLVTAGENDPVVAEGASVESPLFTEFQEAEYIQELSPEDKLILEQVFSDLVHKMAR